MSFWKTYPNRKDRRKQKRSMASSCMNHGGCKWCEGNRLYALRKRLRATTEDLQEYRTAPADSLWPPEGDLRGSQEFW